MESAAVARRHCIAEGGNLPDAVAPRCRFIRVAIGQTNFFHSGVLERNQFSRLGFAIAVVFEQAKTAKSRSVCVDQAVAVGVKLS